MEHGAVRAAYAELHAPQRYNFFTAIYFYLIGNEHGQFFISRNSMYADKGIYTRHVDELFGCGAGQHAYRRAETVYPVAAIEERGHRNMVFTRIYVADNAYF